MTNPDAPTPDRLVLIELASGRYTWNRYGTDVDGGALVTRAGGSWIAEADAFDAMIDANDDHSFCKVEFDDPASRAEGTGKHVKPPVPGYPVGPGKWSATDPHALDE